MSASLFATCKDKSNHDGLFQPHNHPGILAEGAIPLRSGDIHLCSLSLPNGTPHPPLPLLPALHYDVLVAGKPWLEVGDSVFCIGPCIISSGCPTVTRHSIETVVAKEAKNDEPSAFRYSG